MNEVNVNLMDLSTIYPVVNCRVNLAIFAEFIMDSNTFSMCYVIRADQNLESLF